MLEGVGARHKVDHGVDCIGAACQTDLARSHLRGRHSGLPLRRAGVIRAGSPAGLVDAHVAAAGGGPGSLQHGGTCRKGPTEAAAWGGVPRLGASSKRHIALRIEQVVIIKMRKHVESSVRFAGLTTRNRRQVLNMYA